MPEGSPIGTNAVLLLQNLLCSQSSSSMFETAAWQQMLRDFELSDSNGPLSQFTVAWVKRRAAARQLLRQKVPFLVTVLRALDCSSPDPCVILQDRTGTAEHFLNRARAVDVDRRQKGTELGSHDDLMCQSLSLFCVLERKPKNCTFIICKE